MLTEYGFHKHAFWGVTPLDPKGGGLKEYNTIGNYGRENVNSAIGAGLGVLAGGAGGSVIDTLIRMEGGNSGHVLAAIGALIGGATGAIKSLHKTEKETKVKPTTGRQLLGRLLGTSASDTIATHSFPGASQWSLQRMVPNNIADYYISRKLQNRSEL